MTKEKIILNKLKILKFEEWKNQYSTFSNYGKNYAYIFVVRYKNEDFQIRLSAEDLWDNLKGVVEKKIKENEDKMNEQRNC